MFSYTILRHLRDMRMAFEILSGSSSIRTTSAASIAASEPMAPIAIPISALESTGASFMPSPTNASVPLLPFLPSSSSTFSTLSAGSSWLYTSSIPRRDATSFATFAESPVSITVLFTPDSLSAAMAFSEVGFTISDITMCPRYFESTAMCMIVPARWQSIYSTPSLFMSLSFPAATLFPSTTAVTPSPLISWMSLTRDMSATFPVRLVYAR